MKTENQTTTQPVAKTKRVTASSVFQQKILENETKTDLEIFREVQEIFGAEKIPDRHANYVGWYRGYLRKKGMNPPPAVKAAKKVAAAKSEANDAAAKLLHNAGQTDTPVRKSSKKSATKK